MNQNAITRVRASLGRIPDPIWVTALTLLGFALRLYHLGESSLWMDEAFTWFRASRPVGEGLRALLAVMNHPPLYQLLMALVVRVNASEFFLRIPSVMSGVVALPVIYRVGRKLGGRRLGMSAAALLAVNPFHVWYSRDARDYAFVALLALLVFDLFLQLIRGRRVWGRFTLVNSLLYFTHYFGLLAALAQFAYFLLNFRSRYRLLRPWMLSQGLAFLPLAGWLAALYMQEEQVLSIGWIPAATLGDPLLSLWNFSLLYTEQWTMLAILGLPLFGLALVLGLKASRYRQLLGLWLFLPFLSILIVSWATGRNLYVDRYFIISLPIYLLLLATGVVWLRRPALRYGLAVGLILAMTLGTSQIYVSSVLAKEDWKEGVAYIADRFQEGDAVALRSAYDLAPFVYYGHDLPWVPIEQSIERGGSAPWAAITTDRQRLWILYLSPRNSGHLVSKAPSFDIYTEADPDTRAWLLAHRENIVDERHFASLAVLLIQLAP
jgi:mannosyltransferase